MKQRATRVNASEETIKIGPLGIRFLLAGEDSNESVSVFEVLVPVGQKLAVPAHMNDAYEEVLYGIKGTLIGNIKIGISRPARAARQENLRSVGSRLNQSCEYPPVV